MPQPITIRTRDHIAAELSISQRDFTKFLGQFSLEPRNAALRLSATRLLLTQQFRNPWSQAGDSEHGAWVSTLAVAGTPLEGIRTEVASALQITYKGIKAVELRSYSDPDQIECNLELDDAEVTLAGAATVDPKLESLHQLGAAISAESFATNSLTLYADRGDANYVGKFNDLANITGPGVRLQ